MKNAIEKALRTTVDWLNDEPEQIILQRENAYAMLTWRDFNRAPEARFSVRTAAWIFIITAGIPILVLNH